MLGYFKSATGIAALAANAALLQTATSDIVTRQDACDDVHIFLAKGNNETGAGRQEKLADAICSGLDSCDYENIEFDNRYETVFCRSLEEGARNGRAQLTDYSERCPNSKLVISGYSQGAHVVGDILGGGSGTFFQDCVQSSNEALDPNTSPGDKIVAALLFGDTRHTADQLYNVQSGAPGNGLFPRNGSLLRDLNRYSDVLRAYCVSTDPICAEDMGPEEVETHLNYFDIYSEPAAEWVQDMVADAGSGNSTSTRSASASSSSTTSSSAEGTAASTTTETSEASPSETDAAASASSTQGSDSGAGILRVQSALGAVAALAALIVW